MFSAKAISIIVLLCLCQTSKSDDVSTPHLCLPQSGKCLTVIVHQKLKWNDAEKYCETNFPNGRLASIHNVFDNSIITSWLSYLSTDPWFGGFQIGALPFQYTDASPMDYTNWVPEQPTFQYAQICHSTGNSGGVQCQQGKWRTANCDASAQFICEYGNYPISGPPTSSTPTTTPTPPPVACGATVIPVDETGGRLTSLNFPNLTSGYNCTWTLQTSQEYFIELTINSISTTDNPSGQIYFQVVDVWPNNEQIYYTSTSAANKAVNSSRQRLEVAFKTGSSLIGGSPGSFDISYRSVYFNACSALPPNYCGYGTYERYCSAFDEGICGNHGTCVTQSDGIYCNPQCQCRDGYTGPFCDNPPI
uniref:Uncharacterized protein n=1 Tax=Plectus sambesii TaxID=2011161 RepID=A0A914XU40_9BILA